MQPSAVCLSGNRDKWDAFNWDRHPALGPAKRVIVDWYNGLPDSGAIVLAGKPGSGKTHIAQAIADLYGRWRTSFYSEVALAKAIQRTYDDRSQSEDGLIRQILFKPDLFILDDLGTYQAKDTSWIDNLYNRIFDECLTVRQKPLLITTNLPMMGNGGIQGRLGNRSFSRLCGAMQPGNYIDLFAVSDYRISNFLGK